MSADPDAAAPGVALRYLRHRSAGAVSEAEVHQALAAALLLLDGVTQVHIRHTSEVPGEAFALQYTAELPVAGRAHSPTGTGPAISRVLSSGRPLLATDPGELPEDMVALLPPGSPMMLLAMAPTSVPDTVAGVAFAAGHAPGGEVRTAVEGLVAVAGTALGAIEARRALETDPLTGCLHEAAFTARLDEEVERSRRQGSPLTCLLLEIDDLEELGLSYGEAMRHNTLSLVGTALRREFRRFDRVAVLSGGEVAILLAGAGGAGGGAAARRALGRVHAIKLEAEGQRRPLRVSMGLAEWRQSGEARDLLAEARAALDRTRERASGAYDWDHHDPLQPA